MKKALAVLSAMAVATIGWATATISPAASTTPNGLAVDTIDGSLYSIDLTTGAATAIGATGKNDIEGLTFACGGTLYGVNRAPREQGTQAAVQGNQLVTINALTGAAVVVGALSVEPADAGLTFGTDGKLYMAEVNTGEFYEVNKTTAAVTDIGPMGGNAEITGLATRSDGTIFGYDRNNTQLVTINPTTGAATVVGPSGDLNLVGIDFDADGTLWGISGNEDIVTFNTTTGDSTLVTTYDHNAHDFVSLAIQAQGCAAPPVEPPVAPPAPAVEAVAELTG